MAITCTDCAKEFVLDGQDKELLSRLNVPNPTKCPVCRLQRRLAYWTFGKFRQRQDDITGKMIISVFGSDVRFPVTDRSNWHSDNWVAPSMEIDFSRSFFEQLKELQEQTPHFHMLGDDKNVNCDYSDDVWSCKDCYHCRSMYKVENSHFIYRVIEARDCLDCTYSYNLENCYDNTYCFKNYQLFYSLDSRDCTDSYFLYDCRGVKNSFMCWNLRNKEYCIRNKQYSAEEYNKEIQKIKLNSWQTIKELKNEFTEHLQTDAIHRVTYQNKCEECEGNYLNNCKNITNGFFVEDSENCQNIFRSIENKDTLDVTGALAEELSYETIQSAELYNVKFAAMSIRCRDSEYLDQCIDLDQCFGCVGLKKKKYSILNKQYSENDYKNLKDKIISKMKADGEYGEFLPYNMMYTGYNQSFANYYFPQTRDNILNKGGYWDEIESSEEGSRSAVQLSDIVENYDEVVGKVLSCEVTKRDFKIVPQEIEFYKQHKIPVPRIHPDERNLQRFRMMPGIKPYVIKCNACNDDLLTYYPPEWGYKKILCDTCYMGWIY